MSKGKLYMLPITMGEYNMEMTIPAGVQKTMDEVEVFIVENIKTTRRYLRKVNSTYPIDNKEFFVIDKRTSSKELSEFVSNNRDKVIGVMSEAGCPGIADPGSAVVQKAHQNNINVVSLIGPSSIFLALATSGLNGQGFTFNGYLPKTESDRAKKIKDLVYTIQKNNYAQIFIETPYRNQPMFNDILKHVSNDIMFTVAIDITGEKESIRTKSIEQWKKEKFSLPKEPCVFILGR